MKLEIDLIQNSRGIVSGDVIALKNRKSNVVDSGVNLNDANNMAEFNSIEYTNSTYKRKRVFILDQLFYFSCGMLYYT